MSEFDHPFMINPDIVVQQVENETLLLHPTSGAIFGLDGVSSRVWELMQSSHNLSEVKEQMLEDFEVDEDQLEHDLLAFLEQLKSIAAIESP